MRISASKIKTFQNCSWQYFSQYVLNIPSGTHPKTKAGSVAHTIFELLIKPRHNKYVIDILDKDISVLYFPVLERLIVKLLNKIDLPVDKWISDVEGLINAGIKLDFNIDGAIEKYDPEYYFEIKTDKYVANGYIDLAAKMEDRIVIRDYKSQGYLFTPQEMDFNVQALMYQYALHKKTGLPVDVEFILLRHGKKQVVKWQGEDALRGFTLYLDFVSELFSKFSIKTASSNFAALDKSKWYKLGCITKYGQIKNNGESYHCCAFKFPKIIYHVKDKEGNIKNSFDFVEEIDWKNYKNDYHIEKFNYRGCKYWFPENYE